jgi:hypothetical protein
MSETPAAVSLEAALHAAGPIAELADHLALFGQFVGSWRLEWHGTDGDGHRRHAVGELHFGWVLGGRAVQDTWIVPGPDQPGHGTPPLAFHGTTIRFFDPAIAAWRSTWVEPVNGRVRRFIGRPTEWGIELISDEDEPPLRWTFSDITPNSFTWTGHTSHDRGRTWSQEEQMHATRV